MTVYYSKVGTLTFRDSVINLKLDFRAKIISMPQMKCVGGCSASEGITFSPNQCQPRRGQPLVNWIEGGFVRAKDKLTCPCCGGKVETTDNKLAFKLYTAVDRRIAAEQQFLFSQLRCKHIARRNPFDTSPYSNGRSYTVTTSGSANTTGRTTPSPFTINTTANTVTTKHTTGYTYPTPIPTDLKLEEATPSIRKQKFIMTRFTSLKIEYYAVFKTFEELVIAVTTMRAVPPEKPRLKTHISWKSHPMPTLQTLEEEFAKSEARKFGKRL